MKFKKPRALGLSFAALLLGTTAAHAGNFYVFGDSLSDNGNITRVFGVPFVDIEGANAQYYFDSHFSNGPTWAEYLPSLTGLGFATSNDYAVGGAFTGPITVGGVTYNNISNLEGLPVALPSFTQEVQAIALTGQRFGKGDVVGVWIGANNYFVAASAIEGGADPTSTVTAAVTQAVTQTATGVGGLISLGARTLIVQNLPPLGATPDFNGSAQGAALGDAISAAHNQALAYAMALTHAETGANIIVINEAQIFQELLTNPLAYGKTNLTDACVDTPSCATASTAVQNQYVFWDSVHPTTGTHLLIAEYTASALNSVRNLAVPAEVSALGVQDFASSLTGRIDALRNGASGMEVSLPEQNMYAQLGGSDASPQAANPHQLSGFITGTYNYGSQKNNDTTNGYNYDVGTVTFGVDDKLLEGFAVGAAFGYGTSSSTIEQGGSTSASAYQLGLYALVTQPQFFINSTLAFGFDNYTTKNPGVIGGDITGKPSGNSFDFGLDGGYTGHFGNVIAGPIAGINAAQVNIGSYRESGDAALTQSVGSQTYTRDIVNIGAAASTDVQAGNITLHPQASATLQDLVSGNGGHFSSVFTDEPLVPITTTYATDNTRYWGEVAASLSANITARLSVAARLETTFAKADGNEHAVSGNLVYTF